MIVQLIVGEGLFIIIVVVLVVVRIVIIRVLMIICCCVNIFILSSAGGHRAQWYTRRVMRIGYLRHQQVRHDTTGRDCAIQSNSI